ncbi:hypothetical protein GGS21DRAFT_496904 [Xylaria nigripes]|nr:hypothetical protein GGS21DRAFT_496904 [Xylaria nigripes]
MRSRITCRAAVAVCALAILLPFVRATTQILTFSDPHCNNSLATLNPADSLGSGPCNQITSDYSSFMITRIGPGCGVTIYGNVPFCSSPTLELGELSTCYNTTWVFFSVDDCTQLSSTPPETTLSIVIPNGIPTTTPSLPPSIPIAGEPAPQASRKVNVGAIVGGSIAGVAILACLAIYFFGIRPRQKQRAQQEVPPPPPPHPRYPGQPETGAAGLHKKQPTYVEFTAETPVYEMSPQYIAEVHEDTLTRHELQA